MLGEWGPVTSRTIDLDHEQLLALDGRRGTRVKVIYGGVWLTEEGEPGDMFALGGEEVALLRSRRALLEGLGATRVEVIEPVRGGGLRRLARRIRDAAEGLDYLTTLALRACGIALGAARRAHAAAWVPHVPRGTLAALAAVVGVAIPLLIAVGITSSAAVLARYM